jgi:hypothetical protein
MLEVVVVCDGLLDLVAGSSAVVLFKDLMPQQTDLQRFAGGFDPPSFFIGELVFVWTLASC